MNPTGGLRWRDRLTPQQAAIVEELARTPGHPVDAYILADAAGVLDNPRATTRVNSYIQRIRAKFGPGAIIGFRGGRCGGGGYMLSERWDRE